MAFPFFFVAFFSVQITMAMGRGCRILHNLGPGGQPLGPEGTPYSIAMEQRGKNEVLIFENYAMVALREYPYSLFFFI